MINGPAWKALIEEEYGDRIMSAIDFDMAMERLPHLFNLARVALNRDDVPADERCGLLEFLLAAPEDKDVRTFVDKSLGRGKTDPACAACDDGDFILQSRHHSCFLNRTG
jgi:Cyanate lyase C-terminal domain